MKKQDVWGLTLPQLGYYLEQCSEHIEFTVKISTMSFGGLFGGFGGGTEPSSEEAKADGTYVDGYKVADEEDMDWLSSIL
ncbi:hypothetical protein SECTIM467_34 [Brevibacillus phage SecTim467]|uniref:Uncharacterized protein n=2 Tax=Jenstvirus jenst TaxID=1982225 RepID=A0A0K2CP74_9CAUD|nr:hypothetical protein AVV11_gp157 [Brevibacillus phage Jenst]ALA07164.1 hypothetical protein JENST_34 [Brevibacillus phage Jenst]ALA07533.1 hypothetical protein SECTIM467_34 [Brevibacillus phage SecTim467]